MLYKFFKTQLINYSSRSITTSCTHNGFYAPVIQHLLKIVGTFFISAAKRGFTLANSVADLYFITPAFDLLDGGLDLFCGDEAGGAGDTDAVAGLQVGGNEKGKGSQAGQLPFDG